VTLLVGDLTMKISESIGLFEAGIAHWLLQRERPVTPRTLASAELGLHFCCQSVPFIKSELTMAKAPKDDFEKSSLAAAARLNAYYGAVMNRIETEPDSAC
jgi:hypothetical protein